MSSTLAAVLDRFGLDADEVAAAVRDQTVGLPSAGTAALPAHDADTLARGGLRFGPASERAGREARTAAVAEQIALLTGPDTATVAGAAGVSESRVRHWAASGALLSVRVGRGLRFPSFQFGESGRPLPGLAAVLRAMPKEWPLAQLAAFMITSQAELTLRGTTVTPAEWLAAGADPNDVSALVQPDW